jgi:hypothetical protein
MTTPLATTDYDVLNVVALKKMAAADAIAEDCGLAAATVDAVLVTLADQGLVITGAGSAFPTDDAVPALAAAAARRYADLRADAGIAPLVTRFETVNAQLLETMSAWQQVTVGGRKVANDHTDADYDGKVITRIDRLVQRLQPLLDALAAHDPRFATYGRRFAAALDGIDQGDHELVSSPVRDSVHTVWFEFHEDLLRTLGRDRTE